MDNIVVNFNEKDAYTLAEKYFIEGCGFDLAREKHRRMMEEGLKARTQGVEGVQIRALLSSFLPDVFRDGKIIIGETEFTCKAFEQISPGNIVMIYAYIITAGELIYSDDDNILKQLYSDIWGTAYTDAGRDMLEEYLKSEASKSFHAEINKDIFLTNSFGPGFYGMNSSQIKDFFKILKADKIGVDVRGTGVMVPLKTCTGFYMILNDKSSIPDTVCQDCIGNSKGCEFCGIRYRDSYRSEK